MLVARAGKEKTFLAARLPPIIRTKAPDVGALSAEADAGLAWKTVKTKS